MAEYTPSWLTPGDVLHWLRVNIGATDAEDTLEVDRVCAATEVYVQRCRPDLFPTTDPGTDPAGTYEPDAEVYQAAVMYAARELRRRSSPAGVETFGDVGVAFPTKYDADIERALRTGGSTVPGFG